MKKKIVIIANDSSGLYGFRGELIAELVKKGNIVTALTPFDTNIEDLRKIGANLINVPLDRRGINPIKDVVLLCRYYKHLKCVKPDMIITYTIKPNIYGGLLAQWLKVPYATNITGLGTTFQSENILKGVVTLLYKLALKKAKNVFFENQENKEIFIHEQIVTEKQTCLLNGAGVNLERYQYKEYPISENIRFLFVGRVMKEKGVDELFAAAKRIKDEYTHTHFDIVGPLEDDYAKKIQGLVDEGVISYYGFQADVRPFIEKCHCFILPSYHEGMANTLLEAAAMGRPLITSNIHGCKEAVIVGENGYLVEKENSDELYQKIKQFLELDYGKKQKMGLNSRKHMEIVYDKKKVVECTIKALNNVK